VYAIGAEQHLAAAYYRNTIIHFFLNLAIAELAVVNAADKAKADKPPSPQAPEPSDLTKPPSPQVPKPSDDCTAAFWDEAMRLRDLLKFEFFFADKDEFRAEMQREMEGQDAEWEKQLAQGPVAAEGLVRRMQPYVSHRILRPFLEAYRVVADELLLHPPDAPVDERRF
jgi:glycerol-3-phosphate O-acyltransferase